jgi:hypothetical protein
MCCTLVPRGVIRESFVICTVGNNNQVIWTNEQHEDLSCAN